MSTPSTPLHSTTPSTAARPGTRFSSQQSPYNQLNVKKKKQHKQRINEKMWMNASKKMEKKWNLTPGI